MPVIPRSAATRNPSASRHPERSPGPAGKNPSANPLCSAHCGHIRLPFTRFSLTTNHGPLKTDPQFFL